jgi:ATP-dependent DNA helicase DinG
VNAPDQRPTTPGRAAAKRTTALLARVVDSIPGSGEERQGQSEMAGAVASALATGTHLVVQAGTGTGKSLAYLAGSSEAPRPVVVATATKALQDQLATKDLPLLAGALEEPFAFAVLKGRSNYVCRQRVAEIADGEGPQLVLDPDLDAEPDGALTSAGLAEQLRHLLQWAARTRTGDRADLSFEPSGRAWAMVSVGPRECPGAFRCPSGSTCFAEAARHQAEAADVVVVNTHLYGAHLAAGGGVLPEHEVVIFDEAHELEEIMTASLGVELAPGRFRALGSAARALVPRDEGAPADALSEVADRLVSVLTPFLGTRVQLGGRSERANDLFEILTLARSRLDAVLSALRRAERGDGAEGALPRALGAAGHLGDDLDRLLEPSEGEVAWVDGDRRNPLLRLSPVDVAPILGDRLWGDVTAILTSATIPPGVDDRLGLDRFTPAHLDVGSPFDFKHHALLYVAKHLPDRRRPEAQAALTEELEALIRSAGGRTLALFTSRRATEETARTLGARLPYRLLVQGMMPKPRLLEAFAAEETSCLFATLGFWQGVDIPGRALSLVTVDRLPFPRPGDPITDARRDRAGDAAFATVDLPRAATLLAQGVGRLIRSTEDQGVVAILDSRLATAGYRSVLLDALPPMRRTTDRREVEAFLSAILGPENRRGA